MFSTRNEFRACFEKTFIHNKSSWIYIHICFKLWYYFFQIVLQVYPDDDGSVPFEEPTEGVIEISITPLDEDTNVVIVDIEACFEGMNIYHTYSYLHEIQYQYNEDICIVMWS
jgi:hypothetical protein